MPKVLGLTSTQKIDYVLNDIADELEVELFKSKNSKTDLAHILCKTPQAVCAQFQKKNLTLETVIAAVSVTDIDAEKLKRMLTMR